MPGLDGGGASGIAAHSTAQLLDARRERVVTDRHAAPDAGEQLLFGDDLRRPDGQHVQHGGCPGRQSHLSIAAPKLASSRVETKRGKCEMPVGRHAPARLRISRKFPGIPPVLPGLSPCEILARESCDRNQEASS